MAPAKARWKSGKPKKRQKTQNCSNLGQTNIRFLGHLYQSVGRDKGSIQLLSYYWPISWLFLQTFKQKNLQDCGI